MLQVPTSPKVLPEGDDEDKEERPHWHGHVEAQPWALHRSHSGKTSHYSDNESDDGCCLAPVGGSRDLAFLDSRATTHHEDEETDYYQRCDRLHHTPYLPPTPWWAWTEEVALVAQRCAHMHPPEPVPLGRVAGPAVRLTLATLVLQLVFFSLFMPASVVVAYCSEDGYAQLPNGWYITLLPIGLSCLALEMEALKYTVIPKLQVLQHFKLMYPMSFMKVKAGFWIMQVLAVSSVGIVNTANIGAFTAMLVKAHTCPGHEIINGVWCQVMQQSLLSFATDLLGLPKIVFVMWLLSFSHWWFAMGASIPRCSEDVYYGVCVDDTSLMKKTQYKVLIGLESNHGSALFNLAEANGMAGVIDQGLNYARKKAEMQWRQRVPNRNTRCMQHAIGSTVRAIQRTILAGGLKNAFQVNMQVTMLAIRRAVSVYSGEVVLGQHVAMASLCLGFVTLFGLLSDGRKAIAFAWEVMENVHTSEDRTEQDKATLRELTRLTRTLIILTLVCMGFVLYTMFKLYMTFTCPSAISNLNGCVNIDNLMLEGFVDLRQGGQVALEL